MNNASRTGRSSFVADSDGSRLKPSEPLYLSIFILNENRSVASTFFLIGGFFRNNFSFEPSVQIEGGSVILNLTSLTGYAGFMMPVEIEEFTANPGQRTGPVVIVPVPALIQPVLSRSARSGRE